MAEGSGVDAPMEGARPLRRDAALNREKILLAAREVFGRHGLGVTLDDVARHAGVGVGTVYRRFPDKETLVRALFEQDLGIRQASAERALAHPDPWEGFVDFLTEMGADLAENRGLQEVIMLGSHSSEPIETVRGGMLPFLEALIKRAQESGDLRAEITPSDIPVIVQMLSAASQFTQGKRPDVWRRYFEIILNGIRQRPDNLPLTTPSLSNETVEQVMGLVRPASAPE
ncbi:TetR/AcrR family transcriptional regulator [Streptomyces prunicolor]|uniref:TetR/AcrR family transcriptional regulator n=1 Tax=Streptomyces prunicolor TaxID=67348 RepID=A0ABU4F403_9ACTN|nr:TetR/AcrR family transcriptional regulator [Streptomyces prunicolor]MCX5240659.1 TetR/AcrR family transcriptional regulator [Streptomyces prunicolor]MDV7215323.1 TetR/AcrR family transcriptional regulator [Streptomyces prunicolor]